MERLNISDNLTVTGSMMSMTSLDKGEKSIGLELSMPESAQETRKMTCPVKSSILGKDTLTMNSSRTLVADSISREKVLTPYWNGLCLEKSKKLLSLTRTGCVGSDLNSSMELQSETTAKSWFSTTHSSHLKENLSETLFPLSMYSRVGFTDSGNTLVRSRKIRIYPKAEYLVMFKRYCDLSRYWYNQTVEYLKQPDTKASLYDVRKIVQKGRPEWAYESPQRIREHAISDACSAVKNAKYKSMKSGGFNEVKFRRKRNPKQGFGFDRKSLKDTFVFDRKQFKIFFHSTEDILPKMEGTRIIKENNRWFVVIPEEISIKKPDNQRLGAVALDPGVRTFITYYSDSCHGKIGERDFNRIYRLCTRLDNAISKLSRSDYRGKKRISRAICRLRWKIKDSIDEIHHKTARFLVMNFDRIYIPVFETSRMVSKLHSKVSRAMLTWSHYRFKEFLKFKGKEYSCEVIEVDESYTSKTCSYCGTIHNIGTRKVMKCNCGANVDRDLNGARGIYLKYNS